MEIKLMKSQIELVKEFRKGNSVICNWSRGGGKTFMLAHLILTERPNRILLKTLIDPVRELHNLDERIYEIINADESYKTEIYSYKKSKSHIRIKFFDRTETEILINDDNEKFDWVFYNEQFPEINWADGTLMHKSISMVTTNNANKALNSGYNCKIIESDIFDLVEEGLYDAGFIRKLLSEDPKSFYKEWAILNKEEPETIDYKDFKVKAMQKLMRQFLSIQDTKDTVLTRKNIIEMIKDLDQLGLK